VNGCKIADCEIEDSEGSHSWSIGHYLHSVYSKNTSFKLGLLCEDQHSESEEEEPPRRLRELRQRPVDGDVSVMYAPVIGTMGLDLARRCSRDALATRMSVPLNAEQPFYPELSGYVVCEIKKGGKILLQCSEQYGFRVNQDVAENHVVVHQSEALLPLTPPCTTIFCIASSHTQSFEYD
jgi:hypothetical protein